MGLPAPVSPAGSASQPAAAEPAAPAPAPAAGGSAAELQAQVASLQAELSKAADELAVLRSQRKDQEAAIARLTAQLEAAQVGGAGWMGERGAC